MSVKINLDSVLRPFVIGTNIGVNSLTKLYYSCLNPNLDSLEEEKAAATFHYNTKVTLYNAATACLALSFIKTLSNGSTIRLSIVSIPLLLFIRIVIGQSLSVQSGTGTVLKGLMNQINPFKETQSLEGASVADNAVTTAYIVAARANAIAKNTGWREDWRSIQGYPILKSWV